MPALVSVVRPPSAAFRHAAAGSSTSPASPAARDLSAAPPDAPAVPPRPVHSPPALRCFCKETIEACSFPFDGSHASERRSRSQRIMGIWQFCCYRDGGPRRDLTDHSRMVSVLSVPNTLISSRRTLRLTATQPSVGEKSGRAMCRKIALPAPGCVGFML